MLVVGGDYPMALAVKANRDLTLRIEEARSTPPSQGLRMLTQGQAINHGVAVVACFR